MKARICRGRIAELSGALASGGRAPPGYLLARSGILDDRTAGSGGLKPALLPRTTIRRSPLS